MLAVLTTAIVFIAVVLAVVHWQIVRNILLWASAILGLLSALFGLLALLGAVVVFIWAVLDQDATIVPLGIMLLVVFFGLAIVAGVSHAIEEGDRKKQVENYNAWFMAEWHKNNRAQSEPSEKDS